MKINRLFAVILILLVAIPLTAQVANGKTCSPATVKGNFGSHAEGTLFVAFPDAPTPPYPVAAVGLHSFDGEGNWTIKYSISLGGSVVPWGATITGTYDVTPDCKITVSGVSMPAQFMGTIMGEGMTQTIYITYTDAARVQSGVLKRTPVSGCSNRTIKGNYGLFGQGSLGPPVLPSFVPVAHIGKFDADGTGSFFGSETFKLASTAGNDSFTASYNVNSDCSVSAEITTDTGEVIHENGVITGEGTFQEIHLIVTNPGWVFPDAGIRK
ncbi:MAG: hypothetical protein ROO76_21390 [Terriglobia bacterium]|nr:hypothetical protein [Terriglobia bacterium]